MSQSYCQCQQLLSSKCASGAVLNPLDLDPYLVNICLLLRAAVRICCSWMV